MLSTLQETSSWYPFARFGALRRVERNAGFDREGTMSHGQFKAENGYQSRFWPR